MHPGVVDATLVWKLSAFLGDDYERVPRNSEGEPVPSSRGARDVIAERLAHAAGEGPEPEADPLPASLASLVSGGLIGADAPG